MRAAAYRAFVLLVLLVSPLLYPALLLIVDHRVTWAGLREMYSFAWTQFRRGYP